MPQVVEHLPSNCQALSSDASPKKGNIADILKKHKIYRKSLKINIFNYKIMGSSSEHGN
jgi:hypothetical protein